MRETWYYIIEEFKSYGFKCIAYGPEFWLGITLLSAIIVVILAIILIIRR